MTKVGKLSYLLNLLPLQLLVTAPQLAFAQTTEQLIRQGSAAQEAQLYSQAEQIWRRVLQKQPKNAQAYLNLGDVLLEQKGKLKEATAAYRQSANKASRATSQE